ncbi:MAG: hypothetical protein P9L95_06710 [Candidatus Tenebribacter mawsonii]|nr:hypothetical protein [Candidatus Tenebribacter mawsonii]
MRVLIVVLIVLISLNLTSLSQFRQVNYNTNLREYVPNKISVREKEGPYTKSISTNYEIKPGEKLNVYNLNGSIKFVGWNKNYVKITAIKKSFVNCCNLSEIHMVLSTLKGLNIKTVNISNDVEAGIDYIINIPKDTSIGDVVTQGDVEFKNLPDYVIKNTRRLSNR